MTTAITHILVPTDFGEAAERAFDLAATLAAKFDAKLTLLHAAWPPPTAYAAYAEGLYWPVDDLLREARKALDAQVAKGKRRYGRVEGVLVNGEPWESILKLAQESHADLIVMGTHGRRGLSRVILGSVAEKVVRLSPVPVLTVSAGSERHAAQATSPS